MRKEPAMFTGIVQRLAQISSVEPVEFGAVLRVDTRGWDHRPQPGDSIAVNGCCLTVTDDPDGEAGMFRFDVIQQTLRMTTLGDLKAGDMVNLEHAVTASTMLGGHIVQGHIDGVGVVTELLQDDSEWRITIQPPEELRAAIVEKGSVALDGVSLTVASVRGPVFDVALIPTTIDITTLGQVEIGSRVNLETDYIAKTVINWLELRESANS
jgi:riboflavin synthase alpha subunit